MQSGASHSESPRVLVVDDEQTLRIVLQGVLEEYECHVATAGSAEEALPLLACQAFDVALLDIVLPGKSGVQLLEEIKKTSADTEVILMTSHASVDSAVEALRLGAYDYLLKPFEEVEEVWHRVCRAVEKRQLLADKRRLLEETKRWNVELAASLLRQRSLIEAGKAMSEYHSLPELLDFFIGLVSDELGVERASLMLVDGDGEALSVAASRGMDGVDPATVRVKLGQGIAGSVAQTGRPFLVKNIRDDPRIERGRDDLGGSFLSAPVVVSVPIRFHREVLGVINLTNRRDGKPFDENDLEYINGMCGQLGVAITQAREFDQLQLAFQSLKDTRDQLVFAERLKAVGQMAAGVAHDFNNVLNVILGKAQIASLRLKKQGSAVPDVFEDLDTIVKSCSHGAEVIRRVQDYTRIRKDSPEQPVSLTQAAREAVEMTRPKWDAEAERDGRPILLDLQLVEVPDVRGNAHELTQVISNLVFNGVEAMPDGGTITISTYQRDGRVVCEVSDSGQGMTPEESQRVFEPFYTTKERGQGLGLAIVYGIVKRYGGSIEVDSSPGAGTTFRLRLPGLGNSENRPARAPAEPADEPDRATVLVVEDNDALRLTFEEALKAAGHHVVSAGTGERALDAMERTKIDVVATDLSMPGMSGLELARRVKAADPSIPVVLLSGWSLQKHEEEIRRARIDLVLTKPCRLDQFRRAIEDVRQRAASAEDRARTADTS